MTFIGADAGEVVSVSRGEVGTRQRTQGYLVEDLLSGRIFLFPIEIHGLAVELTAAVVSGGLLSLAK